MPNKTNIPKDEKKSIAKGALAWIFYYMIILIAIVYTLLNLSFGVYWQPFMYILIGAAVLVKLYSHKNDQRYISLCKKHSISPSWNAIAVLKAIK